MLVGTAAGTSCARPVSGVNSSTLATERRILGALREGRIVEARDVAVEYERRVPGPQSWSLLGRALWRLGEMAQAEEFLRRAAGDGHPEGLLGLARVLAARGEYADALERARPTVQVAGMSERAARFVGGLYWRVGETESAADTFERGAAAASGESAAQLASLAAAVRRVGNGVRSIRWTGRASAASTEVAGGVTWVQAEIGGVSARLRFDPLRWRSSITPQFAARVGAEIATREVARPVSVAGVAAAMVPLAVLDTEEGDGVLGFDLLVDLRWRWVPASGELLVGAAHNRDEVSRFQRALANTHWVSVRTVLDGLAVQLVLVPRVGDRPVLASIAHDGIAAISRTAARRLAHDTVPEVGADLRLLTRVGGWQDEFDYRVVPETGAMSQVPLPVPVILGAEFARRWAWRWSPGSRQMALIELPDIGAEGS